MPALRVLIKKYENRRLYDTANSRYVNLDDIAQMLREGNDVQVVDAASGEDLTRIILTQIIVEHAKEPDSGFPLDLLRQMVITPGKAGKEGLLKYMRTMMDLYQNTYRAFTPGLSPFEFFEGKMPTAPPAPTPPQTAAEASSPAATNRTAVEDLHRRIEELERLVAANRHPAPRPAKAKKKARTTRSANK